MFNHIRYTDKYFIRSKIILEREDINPQVVYQVFFRSSGIFKPPEELIKFFESLKRKIKVKMLTNGQSFSALEPVMELQGPVQELIDLETIYLGILSSSASRPDFDKINKISKELVDLVPDRPLYYFGARHYHYKYDKQIAKICLDNGFAGTSTDEGSSNIGQKGIGTIPHALILSLCSKYNKEIAGLKALELFDKYIPKQIPRIGLVDTFNHEIDEALLFSKSIKNLFAIRIDTAGENYMQGLDKHNEYNERGVSPQGVYLVRKALNQNGFSHVKIFLSSGFGNISKVKKFLDFEKQKNIRLFDALGIGAFYNANFATADIVKVNKLLLAKTGRRYKENSRLKTIYDNQ